MSLRQIQNVYNWNNYLISEHCDVNVGSRMISIARKWVNLSSVSSFRKLNILYDTCDSGSPPSCSFVILRWKETETDRSEQMLENNEILMLN